MNNAKFRSCHRNLDEKLIELVKQYPILYDFNDARYMNFNEREVVWHRIGDMLKRPASECKSRWINIRDINRRILRNVIRHPANGRRLYKYYKQLEFMKPFYRDVSLQNFVDNANSDEPDETKSQSDNEETELDSDPLIEMAEDGSLDDEPIVEMKYSQDKSRKLNQKNIAPVKRKRKQRDNNEKPQQSSAALTHDSCEPNTLNDLDPASTLDAFLLSIGATMKKFTPYHQNLAKSKIFNIVQQHELQQIMNMKERRLKSENK